VEGSEGRKALRREKNIQLLLCGGLARGVVVVQEEENVDNDFIVCGFARLFSFYSTEPESEPERLIFSSRTLVVF
jgi:hypothetical protein